MTVSANDRRKQSVATASQTSFPYDFEIEVSSDLVVTQKIDATGVVTVLTETTDYTVNNVGNPAGGTIDLVTGAAVDDIITCEGQTPVARGTDFDTGGDYFATTVNDAEDKQYFLLQELTRDIERSLILPTSALDAVSTTLPEPVANTFLGWASDGLSLVNQATTDTTVSAFMTTLLDDTTAAEARTTLGAEAADPDILKADTTDNLEVGFTADVYDLGNSGTSSFTIAFANGNEQKMSQTGVFTFEDPTTGEGNAEIEVTQDGTGHAAPTFTGFSATLLPGSGTWNTAPNAINNVVMRRVGTTTRYGVYPSV